MTFTSTVGRLVAVAAVLTACGGGGGGGDAAVSTAGVAAVAGLRCSAGTGAGWCWQYPQPWGHTISDVRFISADEGWAVGDGGALLRTRDGGTTWEERFMADGLALAAIRFTDSRQGWLLGADGGRLWRTLDGGQTWVAAGPVPLDHAAGLQLSPAGALIVRGDADLRQAEASATVSSDDGGVTWRPLSAVMQIAGDGTVFDSQSGELSIDGGHRFVLPTAWASGPRASALWADEGGHAVALIDERSAANPDGALRYLQRPGPQAAWSALAAPAGALPDDLSTTFDLFALGAWAQVSRSNVDTRLWHAATPVQGWQAVVPPAAAGSFFVPHAVDGRSMWLQPVPAQDRIQLSTDAGAQWRTLVLGDLGLPGAAGLPRSISRDGGQGLLLAAGAPAHAYAAPLAWRRSTDQGQRWTSLPGSRPHGDDITALWMIDGQRGLAVSRWGRLLETVDAGLHWQPAATQLVRAPASDDPGLSLLRFTPDGTGWLGDGRQLRRSLDGGRTWPALDLTLPGFVVGLHFIDNDNGFLVTASSCASIGLQALPCRRRLHASHDGGRTWTALGKADDDVAAVLMDSTLRGVGVVNGRSSTTADGGKTWTEADFDPVGTHEVVRLARGAGAWWQLLGNDLLRSTDAGRNWDRVALPEGLRVALASAGQVPVSLTDIAFAPGSQQGWIVGTDGVVLATTDGGRTWLRQRSGTQMGLVALHVAGPRAVWIGGSYGVVLASATGGQ